MYKESSYLLTKVKITKNSTVCGNWSTQSVSIDLIAESFYFVFYSLEHNLISHYFCQFKH